MAFLRTITRDDGVSVDGLPMIPSLSIHEDVTTVARFSGLISLAREACTPEAVLTASESAFTISRLAVGILEHHGIGVKIEMHPEDEDMDRPSVRYRTAHFWL